MAAQSLAGSLRHPALVCVRDALIPAHRTAALSREQLYQVYAWGHMLQICASVSGLHCTCSHRRTADEPTGWLKQSMTPLGMVSIKNSRLHMHMITEERLEMY